VIRRWQSGQSMPEYLLCCAVLCVALCLRDDSGRPVVVQLALALRNYVRGIAFLLSLP
jgi:hypothetical protein